jgi:hypothetical protein
MACAESRGWTTLTAGAAAALPTAAVERLALPVTPAVNPVIVLPPPHVPADKPRRRPSILMPLFLSLMVVVGVAGVIVWQAGLMPDIVSFAQNLAFWNQPQEQTKQDPPSPQKSPVPDPVEHEPDATVAPAPPVQRDQPNPPAADPVVAKPSPLAPPAVTSAQEAEPAPPVKAPREVSKIPAARLQDVWVSTNPPGAKVVLDDDLSQACRTPCIVHAMTGVHNLTISQAGYENEYREIRVGETAQDVPPITLRKPSGTLMLTTNPPGASVRVDGKLVGQVTPAAISLPPGSYSITVEKGGQSRTQRVEIQQSIVYLPISISP